MSNDVRVITDNDISWIWYLFTKKYEKRFDGISTEGWLRNVVIKSPLIFNAIRSDNAVCITLLSCLPWLPTEFEANVIIAVADDNALWELVRLLRASIEWAKGRKCITWKIAGDTDYDLTPMAKRLGAKDLIPRACIRFK